MCRVESKYLYMRWSVCKMCVVYVFVWEKHGPAKHFVRLLVFVLLLLLLFSLSSPFKSLILFSGLFGEWREKPLWDVAAWNADFFNPSFTFFEYVNLMLGVIFYGDVVSTPRKITNLRQRMVKRVVDSLSILDFLFLSSSLSLTHCLCVNVFVFLPFVRTKLWWTNAIIQACLFFGCCSIHR